MDIAVQNELAGGIALVELDGFLSPCRQRRRDRGGWGCHRFGRHQEVSPVGSLGARYLRSSAEIACSSSPKTPAPSRSLASSMSVLMVRGLVCMVAFSRIRSTCAS